jgi:hypothetical protein
LTGVLQQPLSAQPAAKITDAEALALVAEPRRDDGGDVVALLQPAGKQRPGIDGDVQHEYGGERHGGERA